ncbi:MFS general substrate transporter [Aulographum hederae CBS 113979]|uniref:MFS general substrate transporter n=1 Tax=Aulographum hederae CBS 113979 TaxID=1176131 RepID=A0A6G1HBM5_9PEZI|nr:MFS general substrate transporter [Aulographum hederae CBS 113979]
MADHHVPLEEGKFPTTLDDTRGRSEEKADVEDRVHPDGLSDIIDHKREKKLLHKIDLNLMTLFGALYLMSFLDRSNIGNANLTGFSTDLHLVNNQYGAVVSLVYSTYVLFEPIWTVLLKILTPKYLLTASTLSWGALTIGTAFVTNFSQLAALRVLLGIAEAAILPCILMYITMTYQRAEYAVRHTYIFTASAISGAFGGLLAYGLTQLSAAGLHGWQWMYLVEGLLSLILAPLTFFWLPNSVPQARWLSSDEKELMRIRLERNKGVYDASETFSWSEIVRCLKDWKLYVQAISHFGIDTTLYAITTFMPRIVAGMGFTSTVNAQLLTVPVYFVAAVTYLVIGRLSDKTSLRSPFLLLSLGFCLVGYIILIAAPAVGARYFGVFCVAMGLYATTSLNLVWTSANHAGYYKRAFTTGTVQLVGNSAGAAIGFIFKAQDAPRYIMGMWFALGMICLSIICTLVLAFFLRRGNAVKRRLIAEGAPDQPELGDRNPHFLYHI